MESFKEQINEETILNAIIANRSFLMGVAMIMVIVYHIFCWVYNPIGPLNIGYVGVDIFLFLSGLGLSCSYEKNSITQFYKNRIKRIYPIYLISVLTTYLIFNSNWSICDLFANIVTIGLYTKGGVYRYDWYLESLFTLYILFPLFYYYGKLSINGVISLLLAVTFLLYNYDIPWWYDCILGRLPVFLYGIIFKDCAKSYNAVCFIGLLLYIPCSRYVSPFLATSGLTLPLIVAFLLLKDITPAKIKNIILFVGKHTLEFYIANLFVYWLFDKTNYTTIERLILFFIVQLLATILLIKLNNKLSGSQLKRS